MPIINNTSDIAKLLNRNKASTKFFIGKSLYRAYQKTDTYFGDGQLGVEFIYHGGIVTPIRDGYNAKLTIYTCRFTHNLPTIFICAFGDVSALYALLYIEERLEDMDMLRRYISSRWFQSPVGFEAICRMLKTYWQYNQYIRRSKYGTLLHKIIHHPSLTIYEPEAIGAVRTTNGIDLVHGGNFVMEFNGQFGELF